MMTREGTIPAALGTVVTAAGVAMRAIDMKKKNGTRKSEIMPMVGAGIIGFGLAHVILGGIDLWEQKF
ncbi:MAG: asparagine synthase [Gracilibacter sp. BRH_c7a]|nr:MAG: asparagine synthase [Gracilibacter sp. BRH_c7a]